MAWNKIKLQINLKLFASLLIVLTSLKSDVDGGWNYEQKNSKDLKFTFIQFLNVRQKLFDKISFLAKIVFMACLDKFTSIVKK